MKSPNVCQTCKGPLIPSARNSPHQRFCPRKSCQRARRSQNQRLRRAKVQEKPLSSNSQAKTNQGGFSGEAAVKPDEAGIITSFHPVLIGLASQLIGSDDPEDI